MVTRSNRWSPYDTYGSLERARLASLTPRQIEVLSLIAEGYNNAAIARALVLEEKSVENHINAIFRQLKLKRDVMGHPRVRAALMYLDDAGTDEPAPERERRAAA